MFLNRAGDDFFEASGISGADHPQDARGSAFLDFDRDGWQDVAIVNANAPLFRLLHNEIAASSRGGGENGIVALRFVGGNDRAAASDWSARDGYGAFVTVEVGDGTLVREHRAGEGFAAQNSATMIVGIGPHDRVRSVQVRWPSGKIQRSPSFGSSRPVIRANRRPSGDSRRCLGFSSGSSTSGSTSRPSRSSHTKVVRLARLGRYASDPSREKLRVPKPR